jgi:dihydrofolate reductase
MEGGTTFHFVTGGIHAALDRARDAAGARDVKIGGGVSTVRQYLQAGLIDELHFALSPVLLGRGEAMFEGLDLPALGYRVMESTATDLATHVVLGATRANKRPLLQVRRRIAVGQQTTQLSGSRRVLRTANVGA